MRSKMFKWLCNIFKDEDVRIYSKDNKTYIDMNSRSVRLSLNLDNPEVLKGIHENMLKFTNIKENKIK